MNENNIGISVIEFVEKLYGTRLIKYQKDFLKLVSELPKDCHLVMGRQGPFIIDKDGNIYCGHI